MTRSMIFICLCLQLVLMPVSGAGLKANRAEEVKKLTAAALLPDKAALAGVAPYWQQQTDADGVYFNAFLNWRLSVAEFNHTKTARAYLAQTFAGLQTLARLEPEGQRGNLLKLRALYQKARLNPDEANAVWADWGTTIGVVIQKAPTHPLTLFNKGMAVFYSPVGSPDKGIQFMEEGWRAYGDPQHLDPHQRFWFLLLSGWLGNHYLMLESPKIDEARGVLERALEVEPNYALVRDQLLPATKTKVFCPASETQNLTWTMLATDGSGDGTDAALADAKSLEFAHDAGKDLLWFRFSFHQMPPERAFGINIAADIDGDEGNGFSWWGGDKSLLFDRLITVWVTQTGSGDYVGTVGVGDAPSVTLGNMTNLARNEIPFLVDHEAKTIIVGVAARYLSGEGKTRILGAVGSNMTWNDDVPDGSLIQLDWSKI